MPFSRFPDRVEFSKHFAMMADPSSVTVSLTPRSADSMGLAAVDVSADGIEVRELASGTGSYAFDYVIFGVQKGHGKDQVFLPAETKTSGRTQRN